jgi:predicted DNA-binding transcriptional regulator YafY
LIQTFNIAQRSELFKSLDIDRADRVIIEHKLKESRKIYEFKNKPFESKKSSYEEMKKLEHIIYHQKYTTIKYLVRDKVYEYKIKPYKIIFMNENFYLASEVENQNYLFSLYRISNIKEVIEGSNTFYKNPEIEDFIKFMQTPFAKYREGFRKYLIKVVLEVDKKKAYYFESKKFLSSQQIIERKTNGNLLIGYHITQEIEIDELIKRWLPYVWVIEPLSLKDKIEKELKGYLALNRK